MTRLVSALEVTDALRRAGATIPDPYFLGTAQQVATVTISSELNLLIVGVVLVAFVILAPEGLVGLFQRLTRRKAA